MAIVLSFLASFIVQLYDKTYLTIYLYVCLGALGFQALLELLKLAAMGTYYFRQGGSYVTVALISLFGTYYLRRSDKPEEAVLPSGTSFNQQQFEWMVLNSSILILVAVRAFILLS